MKRNRSVSAEQTKTRNEELEQGKVFRNGKVTLFKLFGRYWCTNKKRSKLYKLDDYAWRVIELGWFQRTLMIIFREVRSLKPHTTTTGATGAC